MIIAITTGEPAGIGPEISLSAAFEFAAAGHAARLVLIGDQRLLTARAAIIASAHAPALALQPYDAARAPLPGVIEVLHSPLAVPATAGRLDTRNGLAMLAMLDRAIDGALSGEFDAVVTAPLQKSIINDAGIPFTGHTEYFAQRTGTPQVVMMLAGSGLRVALATTHLALKDVPAAITSGLLASVLAILNGDLQRYFGKTSPRILVTGLNPHAGEEGYLGREEIDVIAPAIEAARAGGLNVDGPYPADTLFQSKYLDHCDAVLAMYHDQGLPVLKFASFGHGVNITLGLPIVRTSVDHGTALDLAGTGKADAGSMRHAIELAVDMAASASKRSA